MKNISLVSKQQKIEELLKLKTQISNETLKRDKELLSPSPKVDAAPEMSTCWMPRHEAPTHKKQQPSAYEWDEDIDAPQPEEIVSRKDKKKVHIQIENSSKGAINQAKSSLFKEKAKEDESFEEVWE